jgi:streptomycin 6-kinase
VLAELARAQSDPIVLHGDAHGGNLLAADGRGWLWIDLEETCRGPAAWELATMVSRYGAEDGLVALSAYATTTATLVPEPAALAPFRRARYPEGAVWSLCMAYMYLARYRDVARGLLATVLGE